MQIMKYYLAIDIGASSGRHIIGWKDNGRIKTREIYRFANGANNKDGHLVWDTNQILNDIKCGIKVAFAEFKSIESIAVDTFGVDYVLIDGDGKEIYPCYAYRDNRTELAIGQVHGMTSFEYLYSHTGIQFQPFNSIYQLYADMTAGRLKNAAHFLMLPEYINYKLTGVIKKEYTNATTTGLVNAQTNEFDGEIIDALHLPAKLFPALYAHGETVGALTDDIAAEVGGQTTVKLCPSHDTASAFEAVDTDSASILISSGTWSLIGTKLKKAIITDACRKANFTNEGGVGYFRFLKNTTGMWLNVRLHQEFGLDYSGMQALARTSRYNKVFDVNDTAFTAPDKMSEAIEKWFSQRGITPPATQADYLNCVYLSLATEYKKAVEEIERLTATKYKKIYIVGGGAKNTNINDYTAELTSKTVIPMPIEATAIGNLKTQMR